MQDRAQIVVRTIQSPAHLALFAERLHQWLLEGEASTVAFGESRARALLRASNLLDDPQLGDFSRLIETTVGARVALYDLLRSSNLDEEDEVRVLATIGPGATTESTTIPPVPWLSLIMGAFAWQRGYPVQQLDPASPPERYSPAGQVVAHTAQFLRTQIQRSTTERDRLGALLTPQPGENAPTLEDVQAPDSIPPLPPHFRPPVPVRYPEVARETMHISPDEEPPDQPVQRSDPLVLTEQDLLAEEPQQRPTLPTEPQAVPGQPLTMPPIRIRREQVEAQRPPSPLPPSGVVMPGSTTGSRPSLTVTLRERFRTEDIKTTRLQVVVQQYPDGPGVFGLQVKITCKGVRSYVAGTTDREGRFHAELPVRLHEGLTYDVDVTWPREYGGETERKSITVHADRTQFTLPFYHRLAPSAA